MIIAVDTETRGLDTRKFVCGTMVKEDGTEEVYMTRTEMFNAIIDLIESEKKRGHKVYIYAHNHEYDWYTYARDNWNKEGIQYLNFKPFIVIYKGSGYFLDSYSLFKMSLDKLGMATGMKKGTTHEKLKTDDGEITPEEMSEIIEYCLQDSRIVLNAILTLKERLSQLGYRPKKLLTSGQVAMSTFVSHLRREGLWWKITNEGDRGKIIGTEHDEFVRIAFRGGRNEAFQLGEFENISGLDINSLYPYIMREMPFPDLKSETVIRDPLRIMKISQITDYTGFIEATMEIPEIGYGYLPIRYHNVLIFPNKPGLKLRSVWTIPEFTQAMNLGYKPKEISKIVTYTMGNNIFKKYLNDLYEERKRSDKAMELVIKLMMNSLFGKFGQRQEKKEIKFIYRADAGDYEDWEIEGCMDDRYVVSKTKDMGRRYFVNPVIPALITSHARDYLYMHMTEIEEDDLLYCDTDSIILKNLRQYRSLFEIGKKMGQWKVVFDKRRGIFKGEKRYRIEEEIKMSGVAKRFMDITDFDKGIMKNQRLITMRQGWRGIGEVGTFSDIQMRIKPSCKKDLEITRRIIHDKGNTDG